VREHLEMQPVFRRHSAHVEIDLPDLSLPHGITVTREWWNKALALANDFDAGLRREDACAARKISVLDRKRDRRPVA
jgi:hypothetical protein